MPNVVVTAQSGICPILKDTVSLTVIYNREKDGVLHLSEIKCPIVENPKKFLPKDVVCESTEECPIYSLISETI